MTNHSVEKAWSLFQQIEAEGGFLEAIKNGSIQKRIRASADRRVQDVVSGERKILGANLYSVDSPGEQGAPPEKKFTPLPSKSNPLGQLRNFRSFANGLTRRPGECISAICCRLRTEPLRRYR